MREEKAILVALETPLEGKHTGQTEVNPEGDVRLKPGQLLVIIARRQPRV